MKELTPEEINWATLFVVLFWSLLLLPWIGFVPRQGWPSTVVTGFMPVSLSCPSAHIRLPCSLQRFSGKLSLG